MGTGGVRTASTQGASRRLRVQHRLPSEVRRRRLGARVTSHHCEGQKLPVDVPDLVHQVIDRAVLLTRLRLEICPIRVGRMLMDRLDEKH